MPSRVPFLTLLEARKKPKLKNNCIKTIKAISQEGQDFVKRNYKKDLKNAIKEQVAGDIHI